MEESDRCSIVYGHSPKKLTLTAAMNILLQPDTSKISLNVLMSPQPGQMVLYGGNNKVHWQKDGLQWIHDGHHKLPLTKPFLTKTYYRQKTDKGKKVLHRHAYTAIDNKSNLTLVHYVETTTTNDNINQPPEVCNSNIYFVILLYSPVHYSISLLSLSKTSSSLNRLPMKRVAPVLTRPYLVHGQHTSIASHLSIYFVQRINVTVYW